MSAEPDPLTGLSGLRLPPDTPFQGLADLSAALAVGLVLALALSPLLLRLTQRRARPKRLEDKIAALAQDPDPIRIPALLRLLHARDPKAAQAYDLYRPGGLPDAATLERALREAR